MAISSNFINPHGPTILLQSTAGSTQTVGAWFALSPHAARMGFQAVLQTASAGATAGTTVFIEVANSTAYGALATKGQTIAIAATTDLVTEGAGFSSTMDRQWGYVRANMNSLTSSTAGSAGSPSVIVIANAGHAY